MSGIGSRQREMLDALFRVERETSGSGMPTDDLIRAVYGPFGSWSKGDDSLWSLQKRGLVRVYRAGERTAALTAEGREIAESSS